MAFFFYGEKYKNRSRQLQSCAKGNNSDKQVDVINLDIKKAFDSIPHNEFFTTVVPKENCGNGPRATYLVESSMFVLTSHYLLPYQCYLEFPKGISLDLYFLLFTWMIYQLVLPSVKLYYSLMKTYNTVYVLHDITALQNDLDSAALWSRRWDIYVF